MCFGSLRHVERVGRLGLHPVGQFERLDAGLELRVARPGLLVLAVELQQAGRVASAGPAGSSRPFLTFSTSFSTSVCWVSMYVPW